MHGPIGYGRLQHLDAGLGSVMQKQLVESTAVHQKTSVQTRLFYPTLTRPINDGRLRAQEARTLYPLPQSQHVEQGENIWG
jgi:hypothetical protein